MVARVLVPNDAAAAGFLACTVLPMFAGQSAASFVFPFASFFPAGYVPPIVRIISTAGRTPSWTWPSAMVKLIILSSQPPLRGRITGIYVQASHVHGCMHTVCVWDSHHPFYSIVRSYGGRSPLCRAFWMERAPSTGWWTSLYPSGHDQPNRRRSGTYIYMQDMHVYIHTFFSSNVSLWLVLH